MKNCLWCHQSMMLNIGWETLFLPNAYSRVCRECASEFKPLPGEHCHYCHRPSKEKRCHDCDKWNTFYNGDDPLTKNRSIFVYNEFLQDVITKWKYRGDYIVGEIFKEYIIQSYQQHLRAMLPDDLIVMPVPLSPGRLEERAFNQAAEIARFLPYEISENMERVNSEKQSKKSRRQRMSTLNPFILLKPINKTVLLVDDIYTTGRTIRHAAELLKENGCPEVFSLTLARG